MLRASSNLTSVLYASSTKCQRNKSTHFRKNTAHLAPALIFLSKCVCKYLQLENVYDLSVYSFFLCNQNPNSCCFYLLRWKTAQMISLVSHLFLLDINEIKWRNWTLFPASLEEKWSHGFQKMFSKLCSDFLSNQKASV